jgi:hypothetical protein
MNILKSLVKLIGRCLSVWVIGAIVTYITLCGIGIVAAMSQVANENISGLFIVIASGIFFSIVGLAFIGIVGNFVKWSWKGPLFERK